VKCCQHNSLTFEADQIDVPVLRHIEKKMQLIEIKVYKLRLPAFSF
jgi:hypothetical protein